MNSETVMSAAHEINRLHDEAVRLAAWNVLQGLFVHADVTTLQTWANFFRDQAQPDQRDHLLG